MEFSGSLLLADEPSTAQGRGIRLCWLEGSVYSTGQARGIFDMQSRYFRSDSASLRTASASDALGASVR